VAVVNGVVPLRFRPKVAVAHGPLGKTPKAQRATLKILYGTYDRVVCVSKTSEEEYRGIAKCDEIIPLPFKLGLYMPKSMNARSNIVVHVGTAPRRNPQVSVEAVRILRERSRRKACICGSPERYRGGVRQEVQLRRGPLRHR